jgi:ketosteroid isomerase-like protein
MRLSDTSKSQISEELTMSTEDSLRVVKDVYAALDRGDIQGLLGMLSDDVEWHIPGEGLPLSGIYRGREGVGQFLQKHAQEVEILAFEPREFLAQAEQVAVIGWERVKIRATNRTIELNWVDTFTVRGGKMNKFRPYTDTQALAAAYAYASTAKAPG